MSNRLFGAHFGVRHFLKNLMIKKRKMINELKIIEQTSNYLFVVKVGKAIDIEKGKLYLIQNELTIYNCQEQGGFPKIIFLCDENKEPKKMYVFQGTINPKVNIWINVPKEMEEIALNCPNPHLFQ